MQTMQNSHSRKSQARPQNRKDRFSIKQQGGSYRDMEGEQHKIIKNTLVSLALTRSKSLEKICVLFSGFGDFLEGVGQGRFTVFKWIQLLYMQMKIPRRYLGTGLALTGKLGAGNMNLGITTIQINLMTE